MWPDQTALHFFDVHTMEQHSHNGAGVWGPSLCVRLVALIHRSQLADSEGLGGPLSEAARLASVLPLESSSTLRPLIITVIGDEAFNHDEAINYGVPFTSACANFHARPTPPSLSIDGL